MSRLISASMRCCILQSRHTIFPKQNISNCVSKHLFFTRLKENAFVTICRQRYKHWNIYKTIIRSQVKIPVGNSLILLSLPLIYRGCRTILLPKAFCVASVSELDAPDNKIQKDYFVVMVVRTIWESLLLALRAVRIFVTFGPLLCLYPMTLMSHRLDDVWWSLLLFAVNHSGPAFIKLGQWASTRRDMFSAKFCDNFSQLQANSRPHSWYYTEQKLIEVFGENWQETLVNISDDLVGCGSIAQVYKAYIKPHLDDNISDELTTDLLASTDTTTNVEEIDLSTGVEVIGFGKTTEESTEQVEETGITVDNDEATDQPISSDAEQEISTAEEVAAHQEMILDGWVPVAIKVLHPNVRESFAEDLKLMFVMSKIMEFLFPNLKWLSLTECVSEFSALMTDQMNLLHEAEYLETFADNFSNHPNIKIPLPVRPYTTEDVLVETLEVGEPISSYIKEGGDERECVLKQKLGSLGIDAMFQMIFEHNFVHCDLHPGNILVDNAEQFSLETTAKMVMVDLGDTMICDVQPPDFPVSLVFLDGGITASLEEADREKFKAVFTAVVLGQGDVVADLFLAHSICSDSTDANKFKEDMTNLIDEARKDVMNLSKIQVAKLLSDLFRVLSEHRVKLDSSFVSIILAIGVLEGLGRSLDPDLDILERAKQYLLSS